MVIKNGRSKGGIIGERKEGKKEYE